MDRKESIKTLLLGTSSLPFWGSGQLDTSGADFTKPKPMESPWHKMPDMQWVGKNYWANRLQDWSIKDGQVECGVSGNNRTLHCLTYQLAEKKRGFKTSVVIDLLHRTNTADDYVGFLIGAKGPFEDYRSAAVFGKGLKAGIYTDGTLFIGSKTKPTTISWDRRVRLVLEVTFKGQKPNLTLTAWDEKQQITLGQITLEDEEGKNYSGNLALTTHFVSSEGAKDIPSARFADWLIEGEGIQYYPDQSYGPICFAQYTLDKEVLKLSAQCMPIEKVQDHAVSLEIQVNNTWKLVDQQKVDDLSRTAQFRVESWTHQQDIPYRVRASLPIGGKKKKYYYEGTIAANPAEKDQLKAAVFSCNCDYGFPNNEVVANVHKHNPDIALFLGDQFYESHGGFGIQTSPIAKASLDFLRKWYMFGWSYRDIFRHIPCAIIPDDHDVYHGNVWGSGGKKAPTDEGWGAVAQDQGGYKMPPEWVNMVQRVQTGHLPDPHDPTPVKQNVGVYYTDWNISGISFAIIEDRKFKSAPKNVLPPKADIRNGFIHNANFDIKEYYDIDANLLGDRQLNFLEEWSTDWSQKANMKVLLSQTNFATVATLPKGEQDDSNVPSLEVPEGNEYIDGDIPTADMDSNGWPQKGRDKALKVIRKCFAFHIAGDQHLASTVQYGVDEFRDSGFAFAGPALNNIWPRRWWPSVNKGHKSLLGRPSYTGNFEDGFGNKMTVLAVANPKKVDKEPEIIYNRATGYGIVTFDKKERTIRIGCWPRYVDAESNPDGQYDGWPIIINQEDNYGRKADGYLPVLHVEGIDSPVVKVINQHTDRLEYTIRINGNEFRPKVFDQKAQYRVIVGDPDYDKWKEISDISPNTEKMLKIDLA